eukprot:1159452-Pelagomonas_calceolata.AAC.4
MDECGWGVSVHHFVRRKGGGGGVNEIWTVLCSCAAVVTRGGEQWVWQFLPYAFERAESHRKAAPKIVSGMALDLQTLQAMRTMQGCVRNGLGPANDANDANNTSWQWPQASRPCSTPCHDLRLTG